jgi:hypothetical protein
MPGRRVKVAEREDRAWPPDIRHFKAGDYDIVAKPDGSRELWFRDPKGHVGRTSQHDLTEHDDGTVTVSPSINDTAAYGEDQQPGFHGWLQGGVWSW